MTTTDSDVMPAHRAQVYSMLSLFFLYPDADRLKEIEIALRSGGTAINALGKKGYSIASDWRNLAKSLRENMQEKYTALFISGYPDTPCLPYGSVYLEKSLYGDSTESIRKTIQTYRLAIKAGNEPADHVAVILEFIGYLLSRNLSASETAEYLSRWVYEFLERLEGNTPGNHFYHHLAVLTASFLRQELPRL